MEKKNTKTTPVNKEAPVEKRKISDEYMEVFERYKKRCMEEENMER